MANFKRSQKFLERARRGLEELRAARNYEQAEHALDNAVADLQRCWSKIGSALQHSGEIDNYRGWHEKARVDTLRNTPGEVLAYLAHARNLLEHIEADAARKEPAAIGLNAGPSGVLHIRQLQITENKISIDHSGDMEVTVYPERMKLLPVADGGREYPVPTQHLGETVDHVDPITVLEHGIAFYEHWLDTVDARYSATRVDDDQD